MAHSVTTPAFLARFSCIGPACEDTCCSGWEIGVDKATYGRYAREAPELLLAVTERDGTHLMCSNPVTGDCAKLTGGSCAIQRDYGEDFLSDACHFYPRVPYKFGTTNFMTAKLSCPEIARITLFGEDPFKLEHGQTERLLGDTKDLKHPALSEKKPLALHLLFIKTMLDQTVSPERHLMRMFIACESLAGIPVERWTEVAPQHLREADSRLMPAEQHDTDLFNMLRSLFRFASIYKKGGFNARILRTFREMETTLRVSLNWDTLTITTHPDSHQIREALHARWHKEWYGLYAPVFHRYAAALLSLSVFPFSGTGRNLPECVAFIGLKYAITKLMFMCACASSTSALPEADIIRVIQTTSRIIDHVVIQQPFIAIMEEIGWYKQARLRALLADNQ